MSWEVRQGDCVEQMREMDEASVDAIVTDPPYGIGFMGKEWDAPDIARAAQQDAANRKSLGPESPSRPGRAQPRSSSAFGSPAHYAGPVRAGREWQDWCEAWATEALRVLKPGGHLLAFGGTRTHHRLACAIEDAGFEIRDSLIWLYGSGFPKSLDVSKAIDKTRDGRHAEALVVTRAVEVAMRAKGFSRRDLNREVLGADWHGGSAQSWTTLTADGAHKPRVPEWDYWLVLKRLLGLPGDLDAEVWRLNGHKGKPGENWEKREKVGEARGAQADSTGKYGGWGNDPDGDGISEYDLTAPATPEAQRWQGWGTALKPGHEPIVVARKPLRGTVAETVLEHGTGALNVDGCRIGLGGESAPTGSGKGFDATKGFGQGATAAGGGITQGGDMETPSLGRWPANVVLSHFPECEVVGERKVKGHTGYPNGPGGKSMHYSDQEGRGEDVRPEPWKGHADSDGTETVTAYNCAPGCPVAELDAQSGETTGPKRRFSSRGGRSFAEADGFGGVSENDYGDSGGASRFFYCAKSSRSERGEGNNHPTVKPVALMRWLCRLVTPPEGLILDPFVGSGTTGIAAILEDFDFIGIEREDEYVEIAKARIQHHANQPVQLGLDAA